MVSRYNYSTTSITDLDLTPTSINSSYYNTYPEKKKEFDKYLKHSFKEQYQENNQVTITHIETNEKINCQSDYLYIEEAKKKLLNKIQTKLYQKQIQQKYYQHQKLFNQQLPINQLKIKPNTRYPSKKKSNENICE